MALRAFGPLTKKELGRLCDLSRPTVDKALQALLSAGIVRSNGLSPSSVGRRSVLYAFHERYRYVLGVDCEIPNLGLALVDLRGQIVSARLEHLPLEDLEKPKALLEHVYDRIEAFLGKAGLLPSDLLGIGLGAPAFLGRGGETLTFYGETLPPWREVPAKAVLEERLGVPTLLGNDVNFMALAESAHLEHPEPVLVYLALREGAYGDIRMGGAVLLEGKIFGGAHGNAVSLREAYARLESGEKGSQSAPPDSLLREGRRRPGRAQARRRRRELERHLLTPMLHLVALFDPSRLVIQARLLGGEEEAFLRSCDRWLRKHLGHVFHFALSPTREGEWACARGAALYVLQSVFPEPQAVGIPCETQSRTKGVRAAGASIHPFERRRSSVGSDSIPKP